MFIGNLALRITCLKPSIILFQSIYFATMDMDKKKIKEKFLSRAKKLLESRSSNSISNQSESNISNIELYNAFSFISDILDNFDLALGSNPEIRHFSVVREIVVMYALTRL